MKDINETGVRGYLTWLKKDQPNVYAAVAPIIAQRVPEAFSNYEQSLAQGTLMGFGDDVTDTSAGTTTDFSDSGGFVDTGAVMVSQPSASSGATAAPAVDVSQAANNGASTAAAVGLIGSIVNAFTQTKLAQTQAQTAAQINQQQLQRAQLGLAPLSVSSSSLGIPFISGMVGQSPVTSGTVLLALAGLGAYLLFGRKGKA